MSTLTRAKPGKVVEVSISGFSSKRLRSQSSGKVNGSLGYTPPKKVKPPVPLFCGDSREVLPKKKMGKPVYNCKCPICGIEKTGCWTNMCTMRRYHWQSSHRSLSYNLFLIKPRNVPIPQPSPLVPKEQRAWTCPVNGCNQGSARMR